eukprot:g2734.t1
MVPVVLLYSVFASVLQDQKKLIEYVCHFYGYAFLGFGAAAVVYPYLNFWCQIGGTLGALGGVLTESLQVPISAEHIVTGSSVLSGHLAIRTLLELQGSVLVSYVHQYPEDDGLTLKGPNPKRVADDRMMLLVNGVLSAAVSFYGTSALVSEWGLAKVLRINPLVCFAMMGLFCCATLGAETQGYLTVNGSFVISRPQIEWNDWVALGEDGGRGPSPEGGQDDHDAYYSKAIADAAALAVEPPRGHELVADGIIHVQGCGKDIVQTLFHVADSAGAAPGTGGRTAARSTSIAAAGDDAVRLRNLQALIKDHKGCEAVRRKHLVSGTDVDDRTHFFYEMRPKCSFREMVYDAERAGAAGVILVNPGTRRRVEKLAAASGDPRFPTPTLLTLFVSEADYEKNLKAYEVNPNSGGVDDMALNDPASIRAFGNENDRGEKFQPNVGPRADVLTSDYLRQLEQQSVPTGAFVQVGDSQNSHPDTTTRRGLAEEAQENFSRVAGGGGADMTLSFPRSSVSGGSETRTGTVHSSFASSPSPGGGGTSTPWLSYFALFIVCSTCSILMNVVVFAINNPMVEVLYLKTSKVAKVKAKSWISAFGSNILRALGNRVNSAANTPIFDPFGSICFSSVWFVAWFAAVAEVGALHKVYKAPVSGLEADGDCVGNNSAELAGEMSSCGNRVGVPHQATSAAETHEQEFQSLPQRGVVII